MLVNPDVMINLLYIMGIFFGEERGVIEFCEKGAVD